MKNEISEKKQSLIDKHQKEPLKIGDGVVILRKLVSSRPDIPADQKTTARVEKINKTSVIIKEERLSIKIKHSDIISKSVYHIGVNPFPEYTDHVRMVAFGLGSILHALGIMKYSHSENPYDINGTIIHECNWNPYVYDKKGNKQYYQRDFVWSEKDKQLLVESIYQNIDCGKILVRKRSWDELRELQKNGETELGFNDIVDGKQRLNAIECFINGEFPDLQGNYFGDLSDVAQDKFIGHQLFSYGELPENSKDEDIIKQFLKLNFCGIPQSQEHIDFVKELQKKV